MNQQIFQENEINLKVLFEYLWSSKLFISISTALITLVVVFYLKGLPNVYQSEVVLSPSGDSQRMQMNSQLGGLAALAGVSLGGSSVDKTAIALEVLKSRQFITGFIKKYDLLEYLLAVESWDLVADKPIYNTDVYDAATKTWLREATTLRGVEPSYLEGYYVFVEMFSLNQDKVTGMITVSLQYYSPRVAKEWLELMIKEVNQYMRDMDIEEAQASINYLKSKVAATDVSEIQSVMYSLIEEQTKTLMLANLREEYALKTIDPPISPEDKIKPRRGLMTVLACFLARCVFSFAAIVYQVQTAKAS